MLYTLAHVKWFTQVEMHRPQSLADVFTTPFLLGWALTLVVSIGFTYLNVPLQEIGWVRRLHSAFEEQKPYTAWVMRVGLAVPLLFAGYQGYFLHYELAPAPTWVAGAQILLGLALLVRPLTRWAAGLLILLYLGAMTYYGVHPLIDYMAWLGAAAYLLLLGTRHEGAGIPTLYITTGISLAWAAVEKWVFPHMALDIIAHHGIPTFGFPPEIFLILSGWIELGVAYLLITGVLNRLLSLVVTLLFVTTTMVFGPREILGHWLLHATLITFLIEGTGAHVTPVLWHRSRQLQLAFVGVTLVPFVLGLIWLYITLLPA